VSHRCPRRIFRDTSVFFTTLAAFAAYMILELPRMSYKVFCARDSFFLNLPTTPNAFIENVEATLYDLSKIREAFWLYCWVSRYSKKKKDRDVCLFGSTPIATLIKNEPARIGLSKN
jgi:hypothetical protein